MPTAKYQVVDVKIKFQILLAWLTGYHIAMAMQHDVIAAAMKSYSNSSLLMNVMKH